jgi:hypothetical protein
MRQLRLRRPDPCSICQRPLEAGARAWWYPSAGHVVCVDCHELDRGRAGASAAREYERRRLRRQTRTRQAHPHIGELLLALRPAPRHETSFRHGAEGEAAVADALAERVAGPAIVLHDRRMPRGAGNIDHLAVAPAGVFVIDAKHSTGKVRVSTPLLGKARLLIAGRDRTHLVDGLERQLACHRSARAAGRSHPGPRRAVLHQGEPAVPRCDPGARARASVAQGAREDAHPTRADATDRDRAAGPQARTRVPRRKTWRQSAQAAGVPAR